MSIDEAQGFLQDAIIKHDVVKAIGYTDQYLCKSGALLHAKNASILFFEPKTDLDQ